MHIWGGSRHGYNQARGEQKKPDSQIFPALKHQIYYSFYDVLGNINGKLTLKVYLEQILKPIVKP